MLDRRHTPLRAAACLLAALALATPAAQAQVPPAIQVPDLYAFPFASEFTSPANAASAGLALADRWLGGAGFENPAARVPMGIEVSPLFQRINRQDVASQGRGFEQTQVGYPDFAGARLSFPVAGFGLTAYAWQPVLRIEDFTFETGPLSLPATVQQLTTQRELRAGLAVSHALGGVRLGLAGEWVNRDDTYEVHDLTLSAPTSGDRVYELSGSGFGGSAGVSWEKDADRPWGSWFGAAVRYGSELTLDGTSKEDLLGGSTDSVFTLTRAAEWSGGVSGKVTIAPATRFVAGVSYRQGLDYGGAAPGTGTGLGWSAGIDWKDAEMPWGARFGFGQENLEDAFESKSGLFGFGFTWVSGDLAVDASILHRNMSRGDLPHSADDRVVLSVKVDF